MVSNAMVEQCVIRELIGGQGLVDIGCMVSGAVCEKLLVSEAMGGAVINQQGYEWPLIDQ